MSEIRTRDDHLDWCKKRALDLLKRGDVSGALTSMTSDLMKHPETADHPGIFLGGHLLFGGHLRKAEEVKKFINDFN